MEQRSGGVIVDHAAGHVRRAPRWRRILGSGDGVRIDRDGIRAAGDDQPVGWDRIDAVGVRRRSNVQSTWYELVAVIDGRERALESAGSLSPRGYATLLDAAEELAVVPDHVQRVDDEQGRRSVDLRLSRVLLALLAAGLLLGVLLLVGGVFDGL